MILASEGGSKFNETLEKLKDSAGSTDKAFKTMSETTEFKFKQAMQQAKNALMQFGTAALPTITKVIEKASSMIQKFSELSPTTQEWVIKIGLAVAALGPFLSILGNTISGVGKLGKGFLGAGKMLGLFGKGASATATVTAGLGKAASLTGGALAEVAVTSAVTGKGIAGAGVAMAGAGTKAGILGGALGGLLPIAGGVVLGLGAMAGGVYLASKAWEKMADYTKVTVQPTFESVVDGLQGVSDETKVIVKDIESQVSSLEAKSITINLDGEVTKAEAKDMFGAIQSFADATTSHVDTKIQELKKGLGSMYDDLPPALKKAYDESYKETEKHYNAEKKVVQDHADAIKALYKKASDEKRELNEEEKIQEAKHMEEIQKIQAEARIQNLEEYKILKQAEAELETSHNLETAQKVVENGQKIRDERAKNAEEIYQDKLKHIESLKWANEEDKNNAIKIAQEKRDGTIKAADEEWNKKFSIALAKSDDLLDRYDFVNGKILSEQDATIRKQVQADAKLWADVGNNATKGYTNLNLMSQNNANITEQNLADCKRAWDSYSHDITGQMSKLKEQYNNGEISLATYQQKVNSLKSNKAFADQMSNDLAEIIDGFIKGTLKGDALKKKIDELQSKTIKITTEFVTVGNPPSTNGMHGNMTAKNQGTFSLPTNNVNEMARVIAHDSKTGSYGEVMDLPGGTRIYPNDVSMRMARETAKGIVEEFTKNLKSDNGFSGEIIIPVILDGKEIARVTTPYISNNLANNFNRKR